MIVCPNCNHQNPEGAAQCEACYTPLPEVMNCPSCGAAIQTDANFCGHCGFNLKTASANAVISNTSGTEATNLPSIDVPNLIPFEPLIPPDPILSESSESDPIATASPAPALWEESPVHSAPPITQPVSAPPPIQPAYETASVPLPTPLTSHTQLQQTTAQLLHVQTQTVIELPFHLEVIHVGKPNPQLPPDVDVSGFPDSEVVSRIHANLRLEGDSYYIEDVGSSNGTYINGNSLLFGNRYRLQPGDRIALGKGDKVSFIFQQA